MKDLTTEQKKKLWNDLGSLRLPMSILGNENILKGIKEIQDSCRPLFTTSIDAVEVWEDDMVWIMEKDEHDGVRCLSAKNVKLLNSTIHSKSKTKLLSYMNGKDICFVFAKRVHKLYHSDEYLHISFDEILEKEYKKLKS